MNSHYLLVEARDHALGAADLITHLIEGPELVDREQLDRAVLKLRLAIDLLRDEDAGADVDFEVGETDD
jgi:hypothetical protein